MRRQRRASIRAPRVAGVSGAHPVLHLVSYNVIRGGRRSYPSLLEPLFPLGSLTPVEPSTRWLGDPLDDCGNLAVGDPISLVPRYIGLRHDPDAIATGIDDRDPPDLAVAHHALYLADIVFGTAALRAGRHHVTDFRVGTLSIGENSNGKVAIGDDAYDSARTFVDYRNGAAITVAHRLCDIAHRVGS
jgi:hypothetical protein